MNGRSKHPAMTIFFMNCLRLACCLFGIFAGSSLLRANSIYWDSLSAPGSVLAGGSINITATITNTGEETWGGNHYIAMRDSSGAVVALESIDGVEPGQTATRTLSYGVPYWGPNQSATLTFTIQALEHEVEYFGEIHTRTVSVTVPPPYAGMQLSATTFDRLAPASISSTDWVTGAPPYRLRLKIIDGTAWGWHAANRWNVNGQPLDNPPPPGNYDACVLYWVRYTSLYGSVLQVGPERPVAISVNGEVSLSSTWFHTSNPPTISTNQNLSGSNYRLFASFGDGRGGMWETSSGLNNNGTLLTGLPPAGAYQVTLFWRKYDGAMNVIATSTIRTELVNVTDGPIEVLNRDGSIGGIQYYNEENDDYGWVNSEDSYDVQIPTGGILRVRGTGSSGVDMELNAFSPYGEPLQSGIPQMEFPVSPGQYTVRVTGVQGYYTVTGQLFPFAPAPVITSAATATGELGSAFSSYTATVNVGGLVTFAAPSPGTTNGLPPGLSINSTTGAITGTPIALGVYNVWVTAANSSGSSGKMVAFSILPKSPVALAAQQVTSTTFLAGWSRVPGATGYRLDVARDAAFSNLIMGDYPVVYVANGQAISGVSYTVRNLTANTTYYYRVRAMTDLGATSYSSVASVTTTGNFSNESVDSLWYDLPTYRRQNVNSGPVIKVYDGIADEIIPAGSPRGLTSYIVDWREITGTVAFNDYDIAFNDWWAVFDASYDNNRDGAGDDKRTGFSRRWLPYPIFYSYSLGYSITVGVEFVPEPGYTYGIYMSKADVISDETLVGAPGGGSIYTESSSRMTTILQELLGQELDGSAFYLVRYGMPFAATKLTIGGTSIGVGMSGASIGPLAIPGVGTVTVGTGSGSITLPNGDVITVSNGGVTVNGSPVGGGTVQLGGGITGTVDSTGITLNVPPAGQILGSTVHVNPDGSGSIVLSNGVGIKVDASGRLGLELPPDTPPGIVAAVDVLGKILQAGKGAVIKVSDIINIVGPPPASAIPFPTSGVIADAAIAINKGVFSVGIQTGENTWFWFNVNTLPKPQIAVDANRDGQIAFSASDTTSIVAPYRFWLNDDIDREMTYTNVEQATNMGANEHVVDFIGSHISSFGVYETEEDDISTTRAQSGGWKLRDWENNRLYAKRDLEDLARLWISTPGLVAALHPKDQTDQAQADLYLGLQWADVTGSPAVKIYPHVETDGGTKYLSNATVAGNQVTFDYAMKDYRDTATPDITTWNVVAGTDVFVIPPRHFRYTSDSQPNAYFLFEGVSAGKGRLKLVILRKDGANFTPIGDGGSVWLDLKKPHELIERWTAGDDALGVVQPVVRADSTRSGIFAPPATDEEKDYVLYVHGYNMQEFEKQRWIETTHKRLWHLGYKGRVGGFTWPCSQLAPPYDESEERAWQSAQQLKNLLSSLKIAGYRVHMIAHSQGNVVAGEALRLAGANSDVVRTYVASQAAIQADCYNTNNLQIQDWGSSDSGTPNICLSYPGAGGPYLGTSIMQGAATKFANFYNLSDYALTGNSIAFPVHPGWEADQRLKPNGSLWVFSYSFAYTSGIGFQKFENGGWQTLQLPDDRYRIFSYAAEGRSKALGTQPTGGVFTSFTNLQSLGYADEHIWHSGQFRGSQAGRYQYWIKFLDAALIPHLNP